MPASTFDINLLSQTRFDTKPLSKFLRWALTYGRYIIIGTQVIVLLAFFSRFKLDRDMSDLQEKIDQKVNIIQALYPTEQNTRIIQYRLDTLSKLENERSYYLQLLNTFSQNTPADVYINRLTLRQNQLSIAGSSTTGQAMSDFLKFIRNNENFSQINLETLSRNADYSLSFTISMDIRYISKKEPVNTTVFNYRK